MDISQLALDSCVIVESMNDLDSNIICRGHRYIPTCIRLVISKKNLWLLKTMNTLIFYICLAVTVHAKKYTLLCENHQKLDHAAMGVSAVPFNPTSGSLRGTFIGGITPSSSE